MEVSGATPAGGGRWPSTDSSTTWKAISKTQASTTADNFIIIMNAFLGNLRITNEK